MLPASVHQSASRLSRSVKVRTALARRRDLAASRAAVNADRVLAELARVGFADLSVYDQLLESGDLSSLPPGAAAALSEVTVDTYADGRGAGAREVRRVRIKLHPKLAALEALGKHLGLWQNDTDDGLGIPDTAAVVNLTLGELRAGIQLLRESFREDLPVEPNTTKSVQLCRPGTTLASGLPAESDARSADA